MKKVRLVLILVALLAPISSFAMMSWQCIDIMSCRFCVFIDEDGTKGGEYIRCP